jgi:hypothetical protein
MKLYPIETGGLMVAPCLVCCPKPFGIKQSTDANNLIDIAARCLLVKMVNA